MRSLMRALRGMSNTVRSMARFVSFVVMRVWGLSSLSIRAICMAPSLGSEFSTM